MDEPHGFRHIRDVLAEYLLAEHLGVIGRPSVASIRSGFADLDHLLGGFHHASLGVVAGPRRAGKTALALTAVRNAALHSGLSSLICCEGERRQEVALRLLAIESGIDSARIIRAEHSEAEVAGIVDALDTLTTAPVYIRDVGASDTEPLDANFRGFTAEPGIQLVILDADLPSGVGTGAASLDELFRLLVTSARAFDVPLLVTYDFPATGEEPARSDFMDAAQSYADVVVVANRGAAEEGRSSIIELRVVKNRHGPIGQISLFLTPSGELIDLEHVPPPSAPGGQLA